jgi:hypothetical protein
VPGAKPYSLLHTATNPIARMLPLQKEQMMVYRMGEKYPPIGWLAGHCPTWEAVTLVLAPLGNQQVRVNLQRDYTLLSISVTNTSNVNGGFRAQLYDIKKQLRFSDRGVQQQLMGGPIGGGAGFGPGTFFLREPYRFDLPDSQVLVVAQNLENVQNLVQIALYGSALRFNQVSGSAVEFPGGSVSSATPQGGG